MEYVVTFPIFTFARVHKVFVVFWSCALVFMGKQFSQEIISSRGDAGLNQTFVLVTLDEGRNTKVQNEDVNELFHVYFKNTISILSGVVIHVGDIDSPISEIDKALLLLRKFI